VAQPANAAAAYYSVPDGRACNTGYTCLHTGDGQQGIGVGFYNDAWDFSAIPSSYRFIDNKSLSGRNHSSGTLSTKLYGVKGGSGQAECIKAGTRVDDFARYNFGNEASALVWASSCGSVPVMAAS
jgi:hypothetical protein